MAYLRLPVDEQGNGGSSMRRRFRTLGGEGPSGPRLAAAAVLVLLVMLAVGSPRLGAAMTSTTSQLTAGSLTTVANAAAWLARQANTTAASAAAGTPSATAAAAADSSSAAPVEAAAGAADGSAARGEAAAASADGSGAPGEAAAAAADGSAARGEAAAAAADGSGAPGEAAAPAGGDAKPAAGTAPEVQAAKADAEPAAGSSGSDGGSSSSSTAGSTQQRFVSWAEQQEAAHPPAPDGPETEGLPCRASGYCSLGKLGPAYVGEVDSTEGYRKALAASCYKRECVQTSIGSRGHVLGLNLATSMWRLGLANIMLHAADKAACDKIVQSGYTNVTCVWTERQWFGRKFGEPLWDWAVRYLLVARAVWMGYNVMMLDTDSYMWYDPYAFIKSPPFAGMTWLSLQDGGNTVNGGSQYIQNAQLGPGWPGPAAYTIASMMELLTRYTESAEWFAEAHKTPPGSEGSQWMDQFLISDIIASNRLRHPFVGFTIRDSPHLAPRDGKPILRDSALQYDNPGVMLRYPPEWHAMAGGAEYKTLGFNLTNFWLNGTWKEDHAGPRFPPRANYTQFFIQLLEEESGGIKYPDIEGSPPPDWPSFHDETWIFTPEWFLGAWGGRGHQGWWELGPPPPQVIIHVMYVGSWPGSKEYHMKAIHAWSFDAAEAIDGVAIPAGTKDNPLPKVLSLMPGVHLETESSTDFRDKIGRFVKLAMAMGRVLLVPEPVCNSTSWAAREGRVEWFPPVVDPLTNKTHVKRRGDNDVVFYYGLDDDFHCNWIAMYDHTCMREAYITDLDYRELLRRLPPGAGDPSDANTLQLPAAAAAAAGGGRRLALAHRQESGAGGASLAAVLEAGKQKPEPHVLFLSTAPDLSAPLPEGAADAAVDERWRTWNQTCFFMKEMLRGAWNDDGKKP